MDIDAIERLAKGQYAQKKRKGKAPGEGSKQVKVGASDPAAPAAANVTPEVHPGNEVVPTTYVDIVEGESLPSEPANLPTKDCAPDPSIDKAKKRRKGKAAIAKKAHKAHHDEPSWSSGNDQWMDPFDNSNIIRNLIDKFALPEEVDRLANLDHSDMFMVVGPPHACPPEEGKSLGGEKMVKSESLHSALRKEEFISTELKVALALKKERRQEAKGRITGLEAQMSKLISEVAARAMEEFKASFEMKDLNIAFG
ncbi:hypothetical protein COCNU_scaffold000185G000010 [Cocos nucifera]|nr:hypothetical protein [Cocos nucifera]